MAMTSFVLAELQPIRCSLLAVRKMNTFPFAFPLEVKKDQVFSQREHALENIYFWNKERERLAKNAAALDSLSLIPPIVPVPGPGTMSITLEGLEAAAAMKA